MDCWELFFCSRASGGTTETREDDHVWHTAPRFRLLNWLILKQGRFDQIVKSHDYGFGNTKNKTKLAVVLPHSTPYNEIEMVNFTKVEESWDMEPDDDRIEYAKKRKEEGCKLCGV